MATETNTGTFTGVNGILSYAGNPLAFVKFSIEGVRDAVKIPRGGKWSEIKLPGKFEPKVKIKYGLVDPDLFIDAFDDGTNLTTSSDESLHAGVAGNGAQLVTAISTQPSVPMAMKLKIVSTDGFSACAVQIIGTDVNDVAVSETIQVPLVATGSTTTYVYGHQQFKTVNTMVMPAALSANDTLTPYGAGRRSITLGKPKLVTIYGEVMVSATSYLRITMTNCWLSNFPLEVGSASDAVLPEQEVMVRDPDADITITANTV